MADLAALISGPLVVGFIADSLLLSLLAPLPLLLLVYRLRRQPLPPAFTLGYLLVMVAPWSHVATRGNAYAIQVTHEIGSAILPLLIVLLLFHPLLTARPSKRKHHLLLIQTAFLAYAKALHAGEPGIYSVLLVPVFFISACITYGLIPPKHDPIPKLPNLYLAGIVASVLLFAPLQLWLGDIWGGVVGLGLFAGIALALAMRETRNHRQSRFWWIGAGSALLFMPILLLELLSDLASQIYTVSVVGHQLPPES